MKWIQASERLPTTEQSAKFRTYFGSLSVHKLPPMEGEPDFPDDIIFSSSRYGHIYEKYNKDLEEIFWLDESEPIYTEENMIGFGDYCRAFDKDPVYTEELLKLYLNTRIPSTI